MPSRGTRWPAEPHTIAKHGILRKYLGGWLPAISKYHGRVLFIDGFSGPGEYVGGEEGSPIIALRTLLDHTYRDQMAKTEFVFIFIDEQADRIDYLEQFALPRLGEMPKNVRVVCSAERFDAEMTEILDGLEEAGTKLAPAFAFVDPFGFSDTPMELIGRILGHPRSEVFVTVMLENVNRFLTHPNEKIAKQYDGLFGDAGWRELIGIQSHRLDALGNYYGEKLNEHAEFVWSFRMLDEKNIPIYDLFFATNHLDGLRKMKRAMWSIHPEGGRRFSDRHAGDVSLFADSLDTTPLRAAMLTRFAGRTVSMSELERWVLLETDYHDGHIKKRTLAPLEKEGKIECVPPLWNPKRRKGTFPIGSSVKFL